jgi:hypothetical protein
MILMDLSQVMIATLMVQLGNHTNAEVDENILRHMTLNSIRANKVKFSPEYGELIICADSKHSWRKDAFPYYKANRSEDRSKSELNWSQIFSALNNIRDELKEYFPYRVIQVEHAEADDIIGVLAKEYSHSQNVLILSGDKDFQQLQKYPNIKQYSPTLKKYLKCENPEKFLKEHIIRGDRGDGVPNFLSADDSLVLKIRQKSISEKKLAAWVDANPFEFCNESMLRGYKRNEILVNLDYTPADMQKAIIAEYEAQANQTRSKMMTYFIEKRLKNLMEQIGDF